MSLRKLKIKLEKSYGARLDVQYYDGDMNGIRRYFDFRYDNSLDKFLIEDTTAEQKLWNMSYD